MTDEVALMTPVEMRARLAKGEDAFDLSIEKWERIKAWLQSGKEVISREWFCADTCALCETHKYFNKVFGCEEVECCGFRSQGLLVCPLASSDRSCGDANSAFSRFYTQRTHETAQAVIDAIKAARGG